MQAIEVARLPRRRPPHLAGDALERRREREHLDAHGGARHRDGDLQRGPCVGAHRAAAVDQQHESRRPPRAAQPSRRERLAAGLQAGPQRASKVEAPSLRAPAASGATGPDAAGGRTIARHRARRARRAVNSGASTRRRRAGCSSMRANERRLFEPIVGLISSGRHRTAARPGRVVRVGGRWRRRARRACRSRLRGRRRPSRALAAWRASDPAAHAGGAGKEELA